MEGVCSNPQPAPQMVFCKRFQGKLVFFQPLFRPILQATTAEGLKPTGKMWEDHTYALISDAHFLST